MTVRGAASRRGGQFIRAILLAGVAALSAMPALALADEAADAAADEEQLRSSREIVVQAEIGFRNRSEETEPVLVYGEDYFQRFEPLTAGDALKRVPSVTFLSDVIESDGPRLRGLDPGYTQMLINGERVPGTNADRSFFLDRIPAELVKQVEIVRSSSARRTGDAVAGTLNIVLRDAFTMDGGYVRGGGILFDDGKVKPTGGVYYGGKVGPGRLLAGINVQGRYNPKKKYSQRYSDSPENNPNFATEDFDNREDQVDTRNGTDYAGNLSYAIEGPTTKFEISGNFVRTDRTEDEYSLEYVDPTASTGPVRGTPPGALTVHNHNLNKIEQESWALNAKLDQEWSLGKSKLRVGFARFDDNQHEIEHEVEFDRAVPRFTGDLLLTDLRDQEFTLGLDHEFSLAGETRIVIGGFLQNKDRDQLITTGRDRYNLTAAAHGYNQLNSSPDTFFRADPTLAPIAGGDNAIKERRRDLFALVEGKNGAVQWEAGVRWENTRVEIADFVDNVTNEVDYDLLLPSASLKIDTGGGRITASVARTMRRPQFNYVSPALLLAELGDNDLLGNPFLRPETAWGGDLGYEHRLGSNGVIGVNVFYRKVQDLVELGNTGTEGSEGDGTFVYQPRNTGDGKVWGVEFDLSADLAFIGLPQTGVFGNLSLIDSEVTDEFGERRFNSQSKFVYNFGFIHNLRDLGAAFGATYRKQGSAFARTLGEEVTTTYGADLELFVEKRFGNSFTIRAVGSNLLNGKKREVFNKFTTAADQAARDFDEYELEAEEAGPVFQLIARYAF